MSPHPHCPYKHCRALNTQPSLPVGSWAPGLCCGSAFVLVCGKAWRHSGCGLAPWAFVQAGPQAQCPLGPRVQLGAPSGTGEDGGGKRGNQVCPPKPGLRRQGCVRFAKTKPSDDDKARGAWAWLGHSSFGEQFHKTSTAEVSYVPQPAAHCPRSSVTMHAGDIPGSSPSAALWVHFRHDLLALQGQEAEVCAGSRPQWG